jgi:hypothetical protein
MKQTAVEWLAEQINTSKWKFADITDRNAIIQQAKEIEREHMCDFADFVATYTDKNKNHKGDLLHAKSKYDGAERTIDLLEEYYKSKLNYSEK